MRDEHQSEPALDPEVRAVALAYRLCLGRARHRGRQGQRRGVGPGSSLELHDFRDYAPGDDLRHVDWRGYARTDQLRVRLHEAEVAPVVELLLDTSASMAVTPAKERALRGLSLAFAAWCRREGSALRVLALGGDLLDPAGLEHVPLAGPAAPAAPRAALRAGSVRVVLGDALWQDDPAPLLRRVAAGASRLVFVQLLDPGERDPRAHGAFAPAGNTLVDCESGARAPLRLDPRSAAVYRERLDRLTAALRAGVVAQGGDLFTATAAPLAELCRRDLSAQGLLELA
ncbi:MAG: DUF58 domain-containing protein [Planctomycetes bacterium]|nr:DUF58 domain-containing protein [Planctomycetota bacterium]